MCVCVFECQSVGLCGWMSQLAKQSNITDESVGAQLHLTEGQGRRVERERNGQTGCSLKRQSSVTFQLVCVFVLPFVLEANNEL